MIQVTPHMRVLVAVESPDFRCGIDGLAQVCRSRLGADPLGGAVFVFRSRRHTSVKVLVFDGQGFWLCQKRLSRGKFRHWPTGAPGEPLTTLQAHQLHVLLSGGDPSVAEGMAPWRRVDGPGARN